MGGVLDSITVAEARSALAWWLQAGVDVAVGDEPRDWLKPAPAREPKVQTRQSEAPQPSNLVQPDHSTLAELQSWLASSAQMPLASADARRILPHGPEEPAVMLLSDAPALEDFAAGQPIGGDAWELACRMLAAINIPADQSYSASLSCFHTPGVRMSAADRAACAELARQHIRLVSPSGCCCLAMGHRARCSTSHCRPRAGISTRSRECGRW